MKVLLMGATGVMGRRAAGELARSERVSELVMAGREHDAVRRLAQLLGLGKGRGRTMALDVTDRPSVVEAARAVDVVVSCAGPAFKTEEPALGAAIDAGAAYVSLSDDQGATEKALARAEDARRGGARIISGCGLAPGLTGFLVGAAARSLEELHEIEIAVAVSSADASGPASAEHFLHALASPSPSDPEGGRHSVGPAKLVYFPEPVGWVETFRCAHPELVTLAGRAPSVGFRMGLTERPVMDATRLLVTAGLVGNEAGRRRWLKATAPLRPVLQSLPPRGPTWSGARVDAHGLQEGRRTTVTLGIVDRLVNLATIPLVFAALELGAGQVNEPGVHSPEDVLDGKGFFAELATRGLRVARLESESL